ncbi:MAG TPA: ABATE domain-containing protein [Methylomirabilota bacterium]|jgi:predicted RNA-binding Zn ribbon-like protein
MGDKLWRFHLSGCLALDLANTVSWRASATPIERLPSADDYIRWATQARVVTPRDARQLARQARRKPAETAAAVAQAHRLREAIYRAFSALADGARPSEDDLAVINAVLSEAMRHLRVTSRADGSYVFTWEQGAPRVSRLIWPVAKSAADVLTSSRLGRLKKCPSASCGWLFVDRTRNGTRRWCDMRVCGNRAKARRYYHRRRSTRTSPRRGRSHTRSRTSSA